jgi:CRP-like cAMP-binding protein
MIRAATVSFALSSLSSFSAVPNRRIEAIYFPESGIVSVVAVQSDKTQVEVGLIGREGMTGMPIVLGDDRTPHSSYVQAAGEAQCMAALDLANAMGKSQFLRDLLLKYVQAFGVQTTHTAICNARSRLDQRLARWLLMAHDRLDDDHLPLTHEFLSRMLGVRRAGVTEALQALKTQGLVASNRGQVTMQDRKVWSALQAERMVFQRLNTAGSLGSLRVTTCRS